MSERILDVWLFGEVAGHLRDDGHRLAFDYAPAWVAGGGQALSHALPIGHDLRAESVRSFFEGLLPEGDLRGILALRLGVSSDNEFSLLEQIGGDCAGAVSLYPHGHVPAPESAGVRWFDDAELAQLVVDLPTRPMAADADGAFRLSLAGAQDKVPVVVKHGRVGLPTGAMPSTHILKTPIATLPATVLNEALWSRVGTRLGVSTACSTPHRVGDSEMLLVERYDRDASIDGVVRRLHQEDFCQALGIPSNRKYENEGGPSLTDCFALLRETSSHPASDIPALLDAWALSFIAGNHDAHGKNYSLLYAPDRGVSLAPVYDVLNTVGYWKVKPMDRKMAMKVGGENRPDYVRRRHLERMFAASGIGSAAARRRLRSLAARAPAAITDARKEIETRYWSDPHLDVIEGSSQARAVQLAEIVDAAP